SRVNVAEVRLYQGRAAQAVEELERVLPLLRAAYGGDHVRVASCLHTLGEGLARQRRLREAMEVHRRELDVWVHAVGSDHPYVADALMSIGELELEQRSPKEALQPLRRALRLYEGGRFANETANAQFLLARALWDSSGDPTETCDLAGRARQRLAEAGKLHRLELEQIERFLAAHGCP
ncbi:MAG: tetratricopeptide repeat protein, partial [Deltaproteobacteria bacterium]|nr:tetratricopeptide repeat protein [Deltaproteobacteria bacterium]